MFLAMLTTIYHLVNNAGVGFVETTLELAPDLVRKTIEVNVLGPLWMVRAVEPHMPRGGRIINISSVAARMPMTAYGIYGVSKAALDYLTAIWAGEVCKIYPKNTWLS